MFVESETGIRVVTEPSVYLLARPVIDQAELTRFLADSGAPDWSTDAPSDAEAVVECSGRICYASWRNPRPGGNAAYLARILDQAHGRVLEHATWTFLVRGISRSLAQELYTHTVGWSKSMASQRFIDESECAFVVPPALMVGYEQARAGHLRDGSSEADGDAYLDYLDWNQSCRVALAAYVEMVRRLMRRAPKDLTVTDCRKWARQAARSVLPGCVETKVCVTVNARALRHFFEVRGAESADAEIRRLALAWLAVMKDEAVNLFGDYRIEDVLGVGPCIRTEYRKV